MTGKPLYALSEDMLKLLEVSSSEEVLTDEQFEELLALQGETNTKLDGYVIIIKSHEADIEMLDTEIKRLTSRKKSLMSNRDRLTRAIERHMILLNLPEVNGEHFKFKLKETAELVVTPEFERWALEHFPDLLRVKYEPEKVEIRHILEGESVDEQHPELIGAYLLKGLRVKIS